MKPENENAHTHQKYSVNVATPINALLLGCIKAGVNLASSTECSRNVQGHFTVAEWRHFYFLEFQVVLEIIIQSVLCCSDCFN